ncbi:hypothetical protein JTB14_019919 [Gonioctena quinquepunctata]|nr:hypothetical protein JTB14_019919 [Gonioctena quinquepunctata]
MDVDDTDPRPSPSRHPSGHSHYACTREMTAETSKLAAASRRGTRFLDRYVSPMCYCREGRQGNGSNNVYLLVELNPMINSMSYSGDRSESIASDDRVICHLRKRNLSFAMILERKTGREMIRVEIMKQIPIYTK